MGVSFLSGKVVYVSPQGSALLRCEPERLQGTMFSELLAPQDVSTFYSGTAPCRLPNWASCIGSGESRPSDIGKGLERGRWYRRNIWSMRLPTENRCSTSDSLSNSPSPQLLLQSTSRRRNPCSVESVPTRRTAARRATPPFASRPTSSPSETPMTPSHSPAACSSQRGSALDTKVLVILLHLF